MAIGQFQKGLLGYDPMEMRALEQKQWQSLYANAQSPYEKMGIALGQLGGALLGGEPAYETKAKTLNEAVAKAGQQYTQGTAEYYKAIADSLPADALFTDTKEAATQEYLKVKKAETTAYTDAVKVLSDNPDLLPTFVDPLKNSLLQKATRNGWNEAEVPMPQTQEEITAFAKQFGLDKDPMYRQMVAMTKVAEKAISKEQRKEEKDILSIDQIKTNIKLDNARLGQIGKDDFDKGARWNAENAAAREFLAANKIDVTKPLTGAARANPAFVEAYQKALRNDWTGSKGITTPAPKPASSGGDIGQQAKAAWGSYDPNKYDYAIINGQLKRAPK